MYDHPFACVTVDTSIASEYLHVSPTFIRYCPPARGQFAGQRLARARRTDARQQRKGVMAQTAVDLGFARRTR